MTVEIEDIYRTGTAVAAAVFVDIIYNRYLYRHTKFESLVNYDSRTYFTFCSIYTKQVYGFKMLRIASPTEDAMVLAL